MKKINGNILLFIASIIWGSTFVAQSSAMNYIGPHTYNTARFFIGFITLMIIYLIFSLNTKSEKYHDKKYIKDSIIAGCIIGIPEALASALQQVGIVYTTASKAGFLTALYIVFVPFISSIFFKKKVSIISWITVFIALIGFYLLSVTESFTIAVSDLLLVGCALAFALQIISVDVFAKDKNPILVTAFMFLVSAAISFILTIFTEEVNFVEIVNCSTQILYAGIFSCGIAYTFQMISQQDTDPTIASLLMSLESVFAAITGVLILHNVLSTKEIIGCILIFVSTLLSQLSPKKE